MPYIKIFDHLVEKIKVFIIILDPLQLSIWMGQRMKVPKLLQRNGQLKKYLKFLNWIKSKVQIENFVQDFQF